MQGPPLPGCAEWMNVGSHCIHEEEVPLGSWWPRQGMLRMRRWAFEGRVAGLPRAGWRWVRARSSHGSAPCVQGSPSSVFLSFNTQH